MLLSWWYWMKFIITNTSSIQGFKLQDVNCPILQLIWLHVCIDERLHNLLFLKKWNNDKILKRKSYILIFKHDIFLHYGFSFMHWHYSTILKLNILQIKEKQRKYFARYKTFRVKRVYRKKGFTYHFFSNFCNKIKNSKSWKYTDTWGRSFHWP